MQSTSSQLAPGPLQGAHLTSYATLQARLRAAGLLGRRQGYYWTLIVVLLASFAGVWCAVVMLGDTWYQLLCAAALAVLSAQFGFLGHDAAHRQIFASRKWNEWAARLMSGALAGLAYGWWMAKHGRHHAAPNKDGIDPDIAPGAIAFTTAAADDRTGLAARITRYQGWLFFPLLMFEALNLHVQSIRAVLGDTMPFRYRWIEGGLVALRHTGFLLALFLLLPPAKAAAFIGVQLGLFGVLLGASFAPGHKGMPIVPRTMKLDFLRRQVLVSRNIRSGVLTDFAMGGLNYQIEHHLFPTMPRPNLRLAQPLVRSYCAELGLPYTQTGLLQSYAIVVRHLNTVGLRGAASLECPFVATHRT